MAIALFRFTQLSVALLLWLLTAGSVNAGLMLKKPGPDIYFSNLSAFYDPGSDTLMIGGAASRLVYPNGVEQSIFFGQGTSEAEDVLVDLGFLPPGGGALPAASAPGFFALNATVDGNGVLSGGEFAVLGYLDPDFDGLSSTPSTTPATVTLLRGTITEMRNTAFSVGKIDFVANAISSDLAEIKELFGDQVGIKFNANYGAGSSQAISFSNFVPVVANGTADLGRPVPEPGALGVWAVMIGAVVRRRKKSGSSS